LQEAIKRTNQDIYHIAQTEERYRGMACTLTAVLIHNNQAIVANVGDSRAYLLRGGTIRQVTQDHTWVAEQLRAGILTPAEARNHSRKNVVTRSLGNELAVKVDFFSETLRSDDRLLLCSDGLSNVVSESDIVRIVNQGVSPTEVAEQLVALALQRETQDNVTCLVIALGTAVEAFPPAGGKAASRSGFSSALIGGLVGVIFLLFILGGVLWLNRPAGLVAVANTPTDVPAVTVVTPTVTNSSILTAPTSTVASPLPTESPSATATATQTATEPAASPIAVITATQTAVTQVTQTVTDGIDPTPSPPRPAIILTEPIEGTSFVSGTEVTLAWEWLTEPEIGIERTFRVLVENRAKEIVKNERVTETELRLNDLPSGDYTWHVSALETREDGDVQEIAPPKVGSFFITSLSSIPTFTPTLTPTSTVTATSLPASTPTVNYYLSP
jgi:hypothetical protein